MTCGHYSFQDNDAFLSALNDRICSSRIPLCGSLDLTPRCNLDCRHCYIKNIDNHTQPRAELTTEQWIDCIDQAVAAGCLFMLISGGEPMVRDDFRTVYEHARRGGLLLTLFTNGTLINREMADFLEQYPPMLVEISIYGASAEVHDNITRVKGSFDSAMRAVDLLTERGIRVDLKSILMTLNRDEMVGMLELAAGRGLKFRVDGAIFPRLDGDMAPLEYRLTPAEIVEREFMIGDRAEQWRGFVDRIGELEPSASLYECGAGTSCFHITAEGRMKPCLMVSGPTSNLLKSTFDKCWADMAGIAERQPGREYPCSNCRSRLMCDSCPGFYELENGKPDIYSGFVCDIARERVRMLGI